MLEKVEAKIKEDSADILNFVKKYDDFEKGTKEGKRLCSPTN